jgi:type IV pilus assembly protein PilC
MKLTLTARFPSLVGLTHLLSSDTLLSFIKPSDKIPKSDITRLLVQLANLLSANIALLEAIHILHKSQTHPAILKMIDQIRHDLENGNSLSLALARHPKHFDALSCRLIACGEQAGVLGGLLNQLCQYRENMEALKQKVRKALSYPTGVLMLALLISWALLIWVIPTFEDLYKSFASRLPWITQIIMDCSKFLQHQGGVFLISCGLSGVSLRWLFANIQALNQFWHSQKFRLPLLGSILRKSAIARFAMTLGTVSNAGLALDKGLETVAEVCGDKLFYAAIMQVRDEICLGVSLQSAMQKIPLFPPLVIQMIAIGENSGNLNTMLMKMADYYREEINYQVDQLTSLIEPALMVVLGGLIGGMILAMYLPIFSLGSVLT